MESPDDITTRHVLQGQALMDYLVERSAELAKSAIIERDERRKRIVALVFSVIALVGVGGLISIFKIYVRSELDVFNDRLVDANIALDQKLEKQGSELVLALQKQVEVAVDKQIDVRIGAVKKILDEDDLVERYVELALELPDKLAGIHQRGDKYVAEKLSEVVQAAEQMAQLKQITRRRRRFLMSTRQIVDVMTRFNRESEINRLDDMFGDVMATDRELARTLVDHYGQLVVGSAQSVDAQPDNLRRLQRYMQAANDLNYPEKAKIWAVFTEFKRHDFAPNAATHSLLESTQDLTPEDRAEFWYNLYVYTDATNWMIAPDQQGRELEKLMAAMQRVYPEVAGVMHHTLAANEHLQMRLANLRGKNPSRRQSAAQTEGVAPPAAAPATAQSPGDANTLRQ